MFLELQYDPDRKTFSSEARAPSANFFENDKWKKKFLGSFSIMYVEKAFAARRARRAPTFTEKR